MSMPGQPNRCDTTLPAGRSIRNYPTPRQLSKLATPKDLLKWSPATPYRRCWSRSNFEQLITRIRTQIKLEIAHVHSLNKHLWAKLLHVRLTLAAIGCTEEQTMCARKHEQASISTTFGKRGVCTSRIRALALGKIKKPNKAKFDMPQ